jgi:CRP-like cAMP-binding protein
MTSDARLIGPIERLLYLRTLPTIGHLPPSELASIAHFTRERFFTKGGVMLREGLPASSVFFLVEGRASLRRGGTTIREIEAPFAVGFLPVLARDPNGLEVRAETDVVALELGADELLDAFEDNFSLLENGVRQLSRQLAEVQRELDALGLLRRDEPIETPYPEQELDLVQRLILLRKAGPYREASLDSLVELARRSVEVRFEPGEQLWEDGAVASWGMHIVHGVVRCEGQGGKRVFRLGADSVIGYIETYAGLPRGYRAVTETRVVGLRGDTEAFFDALEDNFELGIAFVGFMAGLLTRLYERLATEQMKAAAAEQQAG